MGKQAATPASLSEVELLPREIAEDTTPRQLSEQEHQAIVADRVDRETAALKAENDQLKAEKAELEGKLDVSETARQTAEQGKADAEKAFEDFKAEQQQAKEIAERTDERVAKVREVAAHLKDDFFTDARKARWAAMADDVFEDYVKEMAEASGTERKVTENDPPRETAMRGNSVTPKEEKRGHATNVLAMRRGGAA